jgi:Mg/Co/Ni transporter MgtE
MTETSPITLAFVESHPDTVADEISHLDPAAAAPFLGEVPVGAAAKVLTEAPAWYGARVMAELGPPAAAGLVRAMAVSEATPILRLVSDETLDGILDELPKRTAAAYRNALNFPSWSVGAWMDRKIMTLDEKMTVADAIAAFRRQKDDVGTHCFVIDEAGALVGVADLARLLRSNDTDRLSDVSDRNVTRVYGRTRLAAAAALEDWDRYDALPILGRKGNPIGHLRRAVLRLALDTGQREILGPEPSLLLNIAEAYARTVPALLTTFLAAPAGDGPKV